LESRDSDTRENIVAFAASFAHTDEAVLLWNTQKKMTQNQVLLVLKGTRIPACSHVDKQWRQNPPFLFSLTTWTTAQKGDSLVQWPVSSTITHLIIQDLVIVQTRETALASALLTNQPHLPLRAIHSCTNSGDAPRQHCRHAILFTERHTSCPATSASKDPIRNQIIDIKLTQRLFDLTGKQVWPHAEFKILKSHRRYLEEHVAIAWVTDKQWAIRYKTMFNSVRDYAHGMKLAKEAKATRLNKGKEEEADYEEEIQEEQALQEERTS
jgi:hypothetical protein